MSVIEAIAVSFAESVGPMKFLLFINQLEHLDNVKDMFRLLWNTKEAHSCFEIPPMPVNIKSDAKSNQAREEGNRFYKAGWFDMALIAYDKSIRLAQHPEINICDELVNTISEECDENAQRIPRDLMCFPSCSEEDLKNYQSLGLAYANRSALYFAMKDYDKCMLDIEMALKFGYPAELKKKIIDRQDKCLEMKTKFERKRDKHLFSNNDRTPPDLHYPNSNVPTFSNAIDVNYSPNKGRHVTATRDIQPGEVIAVEKSYCSTLSHDPGKEYHCATCVLLCQRQIPCPTCSLVVFCSDLCRAKGMKEHKKECKVLTYIFDLKCGGEISRMAVKILMHTTYEDLKALVPDLKKEIEEYPSKKLGFNKENKFLSSDYRTVYHMVNKQIQIPFGATLGLCMRALVITKVLAKNGEFFVTKDGHPFKPNREDLILTGEVLLHHMVYNRIGIAIADIKYNPLLDTFTRRVVGVGLYPSLMLMRHSCNAPTVFYNSGHVEIVRVVLPIKKGQEVTLAHTDKYHSAPYFIRQAQMEIRSIKCSCEACLGNWPCSDELTLDMKFKCLSCSGTVVGIKNKMHCNQCNTDYGKNAKENHAMVKKWHSIVDEIIRGCAKIQCIVDKRIEGKKVTQFDYDLVCRHTSLVGDHVQQPSLLHVNLRDLLLSLFHMGM